jgi:hypothetical protein
VLCVFIARNVHFVNKTVNVGAYSSLFVWKFATVSPQAAVLSLTAICSTMEPLMRRENRALVNDDDDEDEDFGLKSRQKKTNGKAHDSASNADAEADAKLVKSKPLNGAPKPAIKQAPAPLTNGNGHSNGTPSRGGVEIDSNTLALRRAAKQKLGTGASGAQSLTSDVDDDGDSGVSTLF